MQRRLIPALLVAVIACSGCYHVTVVTGAPPSPKVINKGWQNSFVIGLVPPSEIASNTQCTHGVAKVETERSFLNSLVADLTYSIYTPMHTEVTCAAASGGAQK